MHHPHFLVQKTSNFLKFMVNPRGQEGGNHFSQFCADVLYRRPLI